VSLTTYIIPVYKFGIVFHIFGTGEVGISNSEHGLNILSWQVLAYMIFGQLIVISPNCLQ